MNSTPAHEQLFAFLIDILKKMPRDRQQNILDKLDSLPPECFEILVYMPKHIQQGFIEKLDTLSPECIEIFEELEKMPRDEQMRIIKNIQSDLARAVKR